MACCLYRSSECPGICWRVGVHSPLQVDSEGKVLGRATAKQLKAASLQLEAVRDNEDGLDAVPRIVCRLHRADLMAGGFARMWHWCRCAASLMKAVLITTLACLKGLLSL